MENVNEFAFNDLPEAEYIENDKMKNLSLFSPTQTVICGILRYDRDIPRGDGGRIFYYTAIGRGTLECVLSINGQVTSTAVQTVSQGQQWVVGCRPGQVHGWVCH